MEVCLCGCGLGCNVEEVCLYMGVHPYRDPGHISSTARPRGLAVEEMCPGYVGGLL